MPDDLVAAFQVRRPLLEAVANALQAELSESFADNDVDAQVKFEVMTADQFLPQCDPVAGHFTVPLVQVPNQIAGTIGVVDVAQITRVEDILAELMTLHVAEWQSNEIDERPVRRNIYVVPPQAMPGGWQARPDVPRYFELKITTVQQSQPELIEKLPRLVPFNDPDKPFPLIMKGGGIKGLAYVGAIEELRKRYKFNWYVGTSAGAITAILLGAGYDDVELRKLMYGKNFRDFFDAPFWLWPANLVFRRGLHPARTFTSWLDKLLADKLGSFGRVKLSDLPNRVTVYASRLGEVALKFDRETKDVAAAYAARCSMSIPITFIPESEQGIRTYDGGIRQNYPVEEFLKDYPDSFFISLFLGPETYEPPRRGFVLAELKAIWTEGSEAEFVQKYRDRTIVIDPRPIDTLDFDLSKEEKDYLIACGRAGALAHLDSGSAEHQAAIEERDKLKDSVVRIRKRRRILKWIKRWSIVVLLTVFFFIARMYW